MKPRIKKIAGIWSCDGVFGETPEDAYVVWWLEQFLNYEEHCQFSLFWFVGFFIGWFWLIYSIGSYFLS